MNRFTTDRGPISSAGKTGLLGLAAFFFVYLAFAPNHGPENRAREAQVTAQREAEAHADWQRRNDQYHKRCDLSAPAERLSSKFCRDETYNRTHMFSSAPADEVTITIEVQQ